MKKLLVILMFFMFQTGYSQYIPLESSGDIPKDFITPSHVKYKKELEQVDRKSKKRTRKNQKKFLLNSNFEIDNLLRSGRVSFNDPISEYIRKVAAVLLKDQPEVLEKLRFYTIRTPSVNAMATQQGIIFVNMGLIAQLENEAELAFILAHEIAHFTESHSLELYLESRELERIKVQKRLTRNNIDVELAKNKFSKEHESEADSLGLDLYLKSEYNLNAIQGVFDVLQYSYLPFNDISFNKSFFEDEYLVFPKEFQIENIQKISSRDDEDDSYSTHPNIDKRRKAAKSIILDVDDSGRNDFIVSESQFIEMQKIARYESLNYYLRSNMYYHAIYNAYLLLKIYPKDTYLKKIIAKSLYGISKYTNADKFLGLSIDHDKIQGEFGALVHFVNKLSDVECNVLALRYAYLLKNDFHEDESFQLMVEDLCFDLIKHHKSEFDDFKLGKYKKSLPTNVEKKEGKSDTISNSKYDKIRKYKEESSNIVRYAFGDFLEDQEFQNIVTKCNTGVENGYENLLSSKKGKKEKKGKKGKKGRKAFALNEDRILIVSPFYIKLKSNFSKPMLIKTEKAKTVFNKNLVDVSKMLDLEAVVLDVSSFSKKDIDKFNDMVVVQEWFEDQLENDDKFQMIAFNQNKVKAIAKKYNVDTFIWTGVVSGRRFKNSFDIFGKFMFNQFMWLYGLIVPKGESVIFSLALDVETGSVRMETFDYIKFIDMNDFTKQRVYDIMSQVKKRK